MYGTIRERPILVNGQALNFKDSFRFLGVDISSDLFWHGDVVDLAVAAVKTPAFLFRAFR